MQDQKAQARNKFLKGLLVLTAAYTANGFGAALNYSEPPDLTGNLALADAIGTMDGGVNSVSGSIDCEAQDLHAGTDCSDSFEFVVPSGFFVERFVLTVSNFSSTENAAIFYRSFNGVSLFGSKLGNFSEVEVPSGGAAAGTYDFQVTAALDRDMDTFEEIGSASFDWTFQAVVRAVGSSGPLSYNEPPDLTSNLAIPDPIGLFFDGINSVSGSINCEAQSFDIDNDCGDSFEFEVPPGLEVERFELLVSEFTSTDGAGVFFRSFNNVPLFGSRQDNFTVAATPTGGAPAGTYDFQTTGSLDFDLNTFEEVGTVSYSWEFRAFTRVVGVPAAPSIDSVTVGDGEVSVAFSPPSDTGDSAISGYTVTSSPQNITNSCAASPCTVAGLDQGTAYTFTVFASNVQGNSFASQASESVTPFLPPERPATPSIDRIDYGDAELYLFVSVATDGRSPITSYSASCSGGGEVYTASGSSSLIVVSGLGNGVAYQCTVTATNAVGTSELSQSTLPVTPEASIENVPVWLLYETTK